MMIVALLAVAPNLIIHVAGRALPPGRVGARVSKADFLLASHPNVTKAEPHKAAALVSATALVSAKRCGTYQGSMAHGGYQREYLAYRPCGEAPRGIVLAIHHFTADYKQNFQDHLPPAQEFGFLLLVPGGLGAAEPSWNAGPCCGFARDNGVDDVGFLRALAAKEDAGSGLSVFATGFSNGGFMSSRLAVEHPGWLSGISVYAGHVYEGLSGLAGTPVMLAWSADDETVRVGGCCTDPSRPSCCCGISEHGGPKCVSQEQIFAAWRRANGCSASAAQDRGITMGTGCSRHTIMKTWVGYGHSRPDFIYRQHIAFFAAQLGLANITEALVGEARKAHGVSWVLLILFLCLSFRNYA